MDGRECLGGWARDGNVPAARRNAFDRRQYLDAAGVLQDVDTLAAVHETVQRRIDARCRQGLHDAACVRRGDDQPLCRGHKHHIAAIFQAAAGQSIEEIRQSQIGHPGQRADDLAVGIANRRGGTENRFAEFLAYHRPAERGPAFAQRRRDGVDIHVVDARPANRERRLGNGRAVRRMGEDATVEQAAKHRALRQHFLHRGGALAQAWCRRFGNGFERAQSLAQLLIDLGGNEGRGGELLIAQHAQHVGTQYPAGKERQSPQAGQKHGEDQQCQPGLERMPGIHGGRVGSVSRCCVNSGRRVIRRIALPLAKKPPCLTLQGKQSSGVDHRQTGCLPGSDACGKARWSVPYRRGYVDSAVCRVIHG